LEEKAMMPNSMPKGPGAALRMARNRLIEHGELPAGVQVDAIVARSWGRSQQAGLMPVGRLPESLHLSSFQLARTLDRQQALLARARPVMEYLYSQTRDSGSMVILADDRGLLLQALGDPDFLTRAERVALSPGASWHERHRGTNAIGTSLAEATPVVINGPEHYLERNGFLTCAASPVAAPDGSLLGVLDISGDHRRHHPHTFCLVRSAAQMIENGLFEALHGDNLQLRFHPLAEGIGTLAEGVVALSGDGYVIGANRAGLAILGLKPADLGAQHLERLLQVRLDDLLDWAHRRGSEPIPLQFAGGGRLFVRIDAGRVLRTVTAQAAPAQHDALSALDIGCVQVRVAIGKARRVLDKPIPVLLQGESGVGKEVFARAMHDSGPRRHEAFVAVDCSSLPENLIEAELFGYAPGAFTGARRSGSPGRIREAQGGTLFLDEIGDMPLTMQSRLLRVLQERQVTPLGGGKAVAVDFALICATHRNLKLEMEAGRFRADLYYRLNGLTLILPPLRERTDFSALLNRLLAEMAPDRRVGLDAPVAAAMAEFAWPGNIRQLVNAMRTACALLDAGETRIGWVHLPDDLTEELRKPVSQASLRTVTATENLQSLSEAAIDRAVTLSRGNMSEAARRLGISRNTLYRRMKKDGQKRPLSG
jgi:transcriptional regulator of acetoin/glycerol metabolism